MALNVTSMTNPNEKVWWMEDAYWFDYGAVRSPRVNKIVAEAERRTWEEAMEYVARCLETMASIQEDDRLHDVSEKIYGKMLAKLSSLSNSSKDKV